MNQNKLKRLFPHASPSFISANKDSDSEVHPSEQKCLKRNSLECVAQGKDKSHPRFEICFRIYSTRPNDWDNPWTKAMQDCLVNAGILHDDKWNVLQGSVISEKTYSKDEERTEIEITAI